jgi:hypothetical protein
MTGKIPDGGGEREATGTQRCPICGSDEPHRHDSFAEVCSHLERQALRFGKKVKVVPIPDDTEHLGELGLTLACQLSDVHSLHRAAAIINRRFETELEALLNGDSTSRSPATPDLSPKAAYHCTYCDGPHSEALCPNRCAGGARDLERARGVCLKYDAPEGDGNMFITVAELATELAAVRLEGREEALEEAAKVLVHMANVEEQSQLLWAQKAVDAIRALRAAKGESK